MIAKNWRTEDEHKVMTHQEVRDSWCNLASWRRL